MPLRIFQWLAELAKTWKNQPPPSTGSMSWSCWVKKAYNEPCIQSFAPIIPCKSVLKAKIQFSKIGPVSSMKTSKMESQSSKLIGPFHSALLPDPQEKYVDGIARKLLSRAVAGCGILVKAVVFSGIFCSEQQDWMAGSSSKYEQSHRHSNILNPGTNLFLWWNSQSGKLTLISYLDRWLYQTIECKFNKL